MAITNNPPPTYNPSAQTPDESSQPIFTDADYTPVLTNWFTAKPYGFRFSPKDGSPQVVMYLPMNPSNITVSTSFATNLTPTIYGTVEEHSPVRYYDITLEGTTGMAPKYVMPSDVSESTTPNTGRSSFSVQQDISTAAGGFFAKTLLAAQNVYNDVSAIFKNPTAVTGLQLDQTGYYAFHNLYRFLLKYKKDTVDTSVKRTSTQPPLVFFNYKDNVQYSVTIRSFVLRRDKENPMLYFYSITMRGYDLADAQNSSSFNENNQTVAQQLSDLGLNGVKGSTFLGDAKEIASQAQNILGSIANGVNQLGR